MKAWLQSTAHLSTSWSWARKGSLRNYVVMMWTDILQVSYHRYLFGQIDFGSKSNSKLACSNFLGVLIQKKHGWFHWLKHHEVQSFLNLQGFVGSNVVAVCLSIQGKMFSWKTVDNICSCTGNLYWSFKKLADFLLFLFTWNFSTNFKVMTQLLFNAGLHFTWLLAVFESLLKLLMRINLRLFFLSSTKFRDFCLPPKRMIQLGCFQIFPKLFLWFRLHFRNTIDLAVLTRKQKSLDALLTLTRSPRTLCFITFLPKFKNFNFAIFGFLR